MNLLNLLGRILLLALGVAGLGLTTVVELPMLETVGVVVCSLMCIVVALLPGRLRIGWVLDAIDLI